MFKRIYGHIVYLTVLITVIICDQNGAGSNSKDANAKQDNARYKNISSCGHLGFYPPLDYNIDYMKKDEKFEREMKNIYGMIMEVYGNDKKEAKLKLATAQKAWERYRDLETSSETSLYSGGTPESCAFFKCRVDLTKERISRLKYMVNDIYGITQGMGSELEVNQHAKKMLDKIKENDK